MFSSLARLRALAFSCFLLATSSYAREEVLFTSSVTYCAPPQTLLIQQFDVAYFAKNESVSFNITAANVEKNLNVTASLLLNVYGLKPVNLTIGLCDILGGALCPLPQYNFSGHDSLSLPQSFSNFVPGIGFKIPDLEAFAQLTLTEVGTGDIKACVQATLSNGWSTHQLAVEWTTGGIALFTFLVAIWHSLSPSALLPFRFLDLISLYQTIATSALLNLNYPSLYRSYALNFAWALSLFSSRQSALQDSINTMRALTGGGLANSTSSSPIGLVNRKLSPFNADTASSSSTGSTQSIFAATNFDSTRLASLATTHAGTFSQSFSELTVEGEVQTVTAGSSNVLQAGIPIYVNSLNISEANAFMTIFLCTLILVAIASFVFAAIYLALYATRRFNIGKEDTRLKLRYAYPSFVRAWSLRLGLIMFTPIVVFAFYQWTLKDSWLSILFSVIAFLAVMACVLYPCVVVIRAVRRSGRESLLTNVELLRSEGPLYAQYRPARYYSFLLFVVGAFVRAVFISFAKSSGMAQIILILILELAILMGVLVLRPHKSRGADVFSSFLAIVRVVCTGLMISFVESIGVAAIPRVAIGAVTAVIYSIAILVVIFNLVLHSGIRRLWRRGSPSHSRSSSRQDSANVMLEKGEKTPSDSHSDAESMFGRPRNPTPERNVPLDPEVNQPYTPSTPTATESHASSAQRDSASTSFGTVLPRRWSFTPLHTPTDSSALDHSPPYSTTLSRTSEEKMDSIPHPNA